MHITQKWLFMIFHDKHVYIICRFHYRLKIMPQSPLLQNSSYFVVSGLPKVTQPDTQKWIQIFPRKGKGTESMRRANCLKVRRTTRGKASKVWTMGPNITRSLGTTVIRPVVLNQIISQIFASAVVELITWLAPIMHLLMLIAITTVVR